jgi:hypothetical protein
MITTKHTYTYDRLGVGDLILLAPEGHPYTIGAATNEAGWEANYWYASDRLASVRDASKWTQFSGAGTIPAAANKVLVDVVKTPTISLATRGIKVTVSTPNYKATVGLGDSDSGSRDSALPSVTMPFVSDAVAWYDFTDKATLFQTNDESAPVTADGQDIGRITSKGVALGATAHQAVLASRPKWKENAYSFNGAVYGGWTRDVGAEFLFAEPQAPLGNTNHYAAFWVAVVNTSANIKNMFVWNVLSDELEVRLDAANLQQAQINNSPYQGTVAATDGQLIAGWASANSSAQRYRFGGEAEISTATAAGNQSHESDFIIGDLEPTPIATTSWDGEILEIVLTKENHANRALWEAYVSNKYGIVWV